MQPTPDNPAPKKRSGFVKTLQWVAVNVLVPVAVAVISSKTKPEKP